MLGVEAGFVVAVPLHRGDNFGDMSEIGPPSWRRRPAEVSRAIDALAREIWVGPETRALPQQSLELHVAALSRLLAPILTFTADEAWSTLQQLYGLGQPEADTACGW